MAEDEVEMDGCLLSLYSVCFSKRQQNILDLREEKEKKEAEKGPAWYYVPVGPKVGL